MVVGERDVLIACFWSFGELAFEFVEVWAVLVVFLYSCDCVDKILSGHIGHFSGDLVMDIVLEPFR